VTVTQSSLPARHSVPGTVRNLKCAAGIRVVERLSCFLIQSNMIAADGAIDEIRRLHSKSPVLIDERYRDFQQLSVLVKQ
jgi:hypothetical protein